MCPLTVSIAALCKYNLYGRIIHKSGLSDTFYHTKGLWDRFAPSRIGLQISTFYMRSPSES